MGKIIISIIQSDVFKSLFSIILTAVLTYFFTRKTDNKKHDMNIRIVQLEKIYLPLYYYLNDKNIDEIDTKLLYKNMLIKKRKYFLYLSNTFLFHLECIKNIDDNNSKKSKKIIKKCKSYISYEYIKLKKELGYPYKSDFQNLYFVFYIIKLLFTFLNMVLMTILAFTIIFSSYLYDNYGNLDDILMYIILAIVFIDLAVGISYIYYQISFHEYIRSK